MGGPLGVRCSGPLTPFVDGIAGELCRLGYARDTMRTQLRLWAQLSRWLDGEGLPPGRLTDVIIDRFLEVRRRTHTALYSPKALMPGLEYLRTLGVVPEGPQPSASTPVEVVLARFREYLRVERGVLESTAEAYARRVRPFLEDRVRGGALELETLSARDVSAFAAARLPGMAPSFAKSTVTALRSLLGFLHVTGMITGPLAAAVPTVACWRLAGLPTGLNPAQVRALLAACDRSTPVGRRDFAVMIMLVRLGLRAGEVAALTLPDIDWRAGALTVQGKGNRHEDLPMPVDVGSALADYLRHGRPAGLTCRWVFVTAHAPHRGLHRRSVSTLVGRAAHRAGVGTVHAHRLRHTAARVLRAGAPLEEVGQLLRHRSNASTAIYAKVDSRRLAELARPWPTGAAQP